jgi:hypothetical protein
VHACIGSVTPETVDELMRKPDIDGALVGGIFFLLVSFCMWAWNMCLCSLIYNMFSTVCEAVLCHMRARRFS